MYDLKETLRYTNQWLGATAKAMAEYPLANAPYNPALGWIGAWREVTERTFSHMAQKPDWAIASLTCEDDRDHLVSINKVQEAAFGDLLHLNVLRCAPAPRSALRVRPHVRVLRNPVRSTVVNLIPDCEVHGTDWHNASDVPLSASRFDIEDYTLYMVDFMRHSGLKIHLIGGLVDPDAAPTDVTDFGRRVTMGQLKETMIQKVAINLLA